MSDQSYAREMTVSASPSAAYGALTRGIDQWWTATSNPITSAGDAVTFSFKQFEKLSGHREGNTGRNRSVKR